MSLTSIVCAGYGDHRWSIALAWGWMARSHPLRNKRRCSKISPSFGLLTMLIIAEIDESLLISFKLVYLCVGVINVPTIYTYVIFDTRVVGMRRKPVASAQFPLFSLVTNKILHDCKTHCDIGFFMMTITFIAADTWRDSTCWGEKRNFVTTCTKQTMLNVLVTILESSPHSNSIVPCRVL